MRRKSRRYSLRLLHFCYFVIPNISVYRCGVFWMYLCQWKRLVTINNMEPSINEPSVRVLFYCYKSIINDTCVSKQALITNAIQTDGEPFKHSTMPTDYIILFSIYLQHEKNYRISIFLLHPIYIRRKYKRTHRNAKFSSLSSSARISWNVEVAF